MNDELKNNSSLAAGGSESHNTEFKSSWHDDYLYLNVQVKNRFFRKDRVINSE